MTMRKNGRFAAAAVGLVVLGLAASGGCAGYATGTASPLAAALGNAACPELRTGAMNASFDADARANATIRAFVDASGDLAETAMRAEADVFMACERMADDLGIDDAARRPRSDHESKVAASCNAVVARMDAILRQGASARVHADVTPPECSINAAAFAACRAECSGEASAKSTADAHGAATADARCEAACKAHADITAHCTEPRVAVRAEVDTGDIGKLVATLERNLPPLIKVQAAYGQRIAYDVDVLVRTGSELPSAFGHLTTKAAACIAAATNATLSAQASLRVSVQASASVSARMGAGR